MDRPHQTCFPGFGSFLQGIELAIAKIDGWACHFDKLSWFDCLECPLHIYISCLLLLSHRCRPGRPGLCCPHWNQGWEWPSLKNTVIAIFFIIYCAIFIFFYYFIYLLYFFRFASFIHFLFVVLFGLIILGM